jgi:hypothetical protein
MTSTVAAAPAAKVVAPKAGTWALHQNFNSTKGGQFTVTHGPGKMKRLHTAIGSREVQYCGSGTVRVLGGFPIHLARKSGDAAYIVGKGLDPSTSYGVSAVKATVRFKGTKYPGDVRIRFDGSSSANGQIDFNPISGLACDLPFASHHHK